MRYSTKLEEKKREREREREDIPSFRKTLKDFKSTKRNLIPERNRYQRVPIAFLSFAKEILKGTRWECFNERRSKKIDSTNEINGVLQLHSREQLELKNPQSAAVSSSPLRILSIIPGTRRARALLVCVFKYTRSEEASWLSIAARVDNPAAGLHRIMKIAGMPAGVFIAGRARSFRRAHRERQTESGSFFSPSVA